MLRLRWDGPNEYILHASSDSVHKQERIHILPETQNGVFKGYVLHISCLEDCFASELYQYSLSNESLEVLKKVFVHYLRKGVYLHESIYHLVTYIDRNQPCLYES